MEHLIQIVLINFLNEVPSNDVLEGNPIQIFEIKLYTCKHVLTGFTQTTPFFLKIFTQRLMSAHQYLFALNKCEDVATGKIIRYFQSTINAYFFLLYEW